MPLLPLLLGVAPTVASWILGDRTCPCSKRDSAAESVWR